MLGKEQWLEILHSYVQWKSQLGVCGYAMLGKEQWPEIAMTGTV